MLIFLQKISWIISGEGTPSAWFLGIPFSTSKIKKKNISVETQFHLGAQKDPFNTKLFFFFFFSPLF